MSFVPVTRDTRITPQGVLGRHVDIASKINRYAYSKHAGAKEEEGYSTIHWR